MKTGNPSNDKHAAPPAVANEIDSEFRAFLEDVELRRALPSMAKKVRYEDRMVAFLDILGWSQLVTESQRRPTLLSRLAAVQLSAHIYDHLAQRIQHPLGETVTHFSDSLVFSWPWPSNHDDLSRALLDLSGILHRLLRSRFLVRGAVVRGKVFHKPSVIFGPAIIEAYTLESSAAIYPRIIVADAVGHRTKGNLLRKDFDGFLFLDFLSLGSHMPTYRPFLQQVKAFLVEEMKTLKGKTSVRQKLSWFVHYVDRLNLEASLTHAKQHRLTHLSSERSVSGPPFTSDVRRTRAALNKNRGDHG
jgi:hypothetical protein